MTPLRLYVNPAYAQDMARVSPLMYPFWGDMSKDTISYNKAFDHQFDPRHYQIVMDPDVCDCHFLPFNIWSLEKKHPKEFAEALANARRHKKKLLIDAYGDTMRAITDPDTVVLRFAQYRRCLTPRDIIVPAYIEDLGESARAIAPRHKSDIPTVGFVGWGDLSIAKYWKTYLKESIVVLRAFVQHSYGVFRKGVFIRREVLRRLAHAQGVKLDALIRGTYSGNTRTAEADPMVLRKEFISNIVNTDYTLCLKGDANQSTRIYEVMSLSRIPLILDTECVMPLEGTIDYASCSFTVPYEKRRDIGRALHVFHTQLSPEAFIGIQQRARDVFATYLRIDAFTPFLMDEIRTRLA